MPDRPLPEVSDPDVACEALRTHMNDALEGLEWEYDDDRTIIIHLVGMDQSGTIDNYLAKLTFLYYPEWPPSVTFLNPETGTYDGTHWPRIEGHPSLAMHPSYGDAPTGMVCNSMTFEYYFWGGHGTNEATAWKKSVHTLAATVAELTDAFSARYYKGKLT